MSPRRGTRIVVPPPLREGDRVGVIATGSAVSRDQLDAGVGALEALGLRVRVGRSARSRNGFLAGPDRVRAADLAAFLEDDGLGAIVFARGGWGTSRILDSVPWRALSRRPKLLMGYSDLTALFAPALDRAGLSCVYGPNASELGDRRAYDRASLLRAFFRPREPIALGFPARDVLAPGRAAGRLVGGCLTLLAHLAGTPWAPRLRGRVLLIEEIEEPPYRLDRMLTQMRLAGMLDGVAAVLIGSLTRCEARPGSNPSPPAREVVAAAFRGLRIPVVAGLRIGHIDRKVSVPLGFRASVDTDRRRILLEP